MGTIPIGDSYLLQVESATPGTYNTVAGQGELTINRSSADIDLSSKTDGAIAATGQGRRKVSADLSIKPSLPDANGYTRLETLCNAYPKAAFNIKVLAGTATVFQASVFGNLDSTSFPQDGAVAAKLSFTAVSVTTDALALPA